MANVKNFGLVGVGTDVQFGKAGTRLVNNSGTFNFKAANGSSDAALTAAGITSSAGNITLTTGNLVASAGNINATLGNLNLSATGATIVVGTDTTLSRQSAGVFQFNGTAAVMLPVGSTGQQPTGVTGMVRINNSATPVLEYFNGSVWTQVSGTSALQTEINNIEAALGGAIDSSGNFVPGGFTGSVIGTTASFTQAIQNVADYAAAHDTLDEVFPQTGAGNVIYSDGANWQQANPGSTSGVQAWDAKLDALSIFDTTGIMVQTGTDTFAGRSLVAPAAGITITNASGVAGNPTFALANDLAGLEGLSTTGYSVRTGDGTWTTRSIAGTIGRISVLNGDGVSSDTSVDLATVSQANTGDFVKVTLDGYGRVTGNTAVTTADIETLVDSSYLRLDGTNSMTADLNAGGFKVTNLAEPTASTDAATKNYVDNAVSGLSWKTAALAATTGNITLSGTQTIDGIAVVAGNRVLVKSQTDATENGIYVVAAGAWARSSDADTGPDLDDAAIFVQQGTVNGDTGWVQTTSNVVLGTSNIVWAQFSGSGAYAAGNGIDISGNVISAVLGSGLEFVGNAITVNTATGNAVQLVSSEVALVLDTGSGLSQSGTGLKIAAAGVTNAMLANPSFTINGDTGTDTLTLGDTFQVKGVSTQGTSVAVTEAPAGTSTFTVTVADASSSQKGVATFNTASFAVTSGDVTIKAGGVSNAQLANSSITLTGDTGSDAVALGESLDFNGDSTFITTNVASNVVSFTLGTVDVPHGGTGLTSVATGEILYGANAAPLAHSSAFSFDGTDTLTIGTTTIQGNATDTVITATATNGDVVLVPDGTGSVVIGPTGAGLIQSDAGESLTVRGNTTLSLESVTGDTSMVLPSGTGSKVTISGPTASDYATGLTSNDLVNKQYVDDAISTGAAAGAIKAVTATVDLSATGSTNVGAPLPAGSTVLSVKVQVTAADTATGNLQVGVAGDGSLMSTAENDTQSTGMYLAETYVVEASSVQVQATVGGTPGGAGSAVVIVEYKVAG